MNYNKMPYFIKIAEQRTLTSASRELNVPISTLSRYLSQLEQELGMPLFQRDKGKLELTKAGKLYYDGIKKLTRLQQKNNYELKQRTSVSKPSLRIGLTPAGITFLTSIYPVLMQTFPGLEIKITEGYAFELLNLLRNGMVDMLLGYYHPTLLKNVNAASFFRQEIYLAVPAHHPLAPKYTSDGADIPTITEHQLHQLEDLPFSYMSDKTITGHLLTEALQALHFQPSSETRSPNARLAAALLDTGYYAGFTCDIINAHANLAYFRMPSPLYIYTFAVFPVGHIPDETETFICIQHALQFSGMNGYEQSFNSLTQALLAKSHDKENLIL